MRESPVQSVKKNFENRAKLVEKLAAMVDKQNGDTSDDQVKARLMGLSNKKLLRLYQVEQKVREKFGTREKLVEHIVSARKKAGLTVDATYQAVLAGYSKARLFDLSQQNLGEAPKKLTAEQKLAKKRGRKQRERAETKSKAKKS